MSESFLLVCDGPPHTVVLTDSGPQAIDVVKLLHRRTKLSLWHCKSLISRLPATILENVPEEVATAMVAELREAGAGAHAQVNEYASASQDPMVRHAYEDAELLDLVRRYVTPDRRYLKLSGNLLRLESPEYDRFARALGEDAALITSHELAVLLEGGWRERRTAAWLIAVSGRTEFRERLGDLLLASEVCCAGLAYCVALATFGTPDDADLLAAYLDRYLRRPDLAYDQPVVLGALLYIDLNLGADQAAHFLAPDGLWHQWLQGTPTGGAPRHPATYVSLIRRLCAFADECAELRSSG